MQIKLNGTVDHVSVRREKNGDEPGELGIDIKYTSPMDAKLLSNLIPAADAKLLNDAFMSDGKSSDYVDGVSALALDVEHEHLRVRFDSDLEDGLLLFDFKMDRVKLSPRSPKERLWNVSMRFTGNPDEEHLADICKLMTQVVGVSCESINQDIFEHKA